MDNLIEEQEIKIEYYESFETDPLRDLNKNSISNRGIEKGRVSDQFNKIQTHKENVAIDEKSLHIKSDDSLLPYINCTEKSTSSEVTWYDSIDIFGRFLCKFCDLKYSTLQTLRFHVKSKHPNQAIAIKDNLIKYKRSSKLKCQICKQRFKDILALKSHVVDNHSLQDMKTSCLYCDAVFDTENELSDHSFVQHKKRIRKSIYFCNICGYRTTTRSHYNQHKNTHMDDKSKKCQYCDYATHYLPNLKIHERIHTNDKVYVCNFKNCHYRCSAKSALRSHQLKHNPEDNILYCDKCSYKTIYRQSLKRHGDCHMRNSIKLKL